MSVPKARFRRKASKLCVNSSVVNVFDEKSCNLWRNRRLASVCHFGIQTKEFLLAKRFWRVAVFGDLCACGVFASWTVNTENHAIFDGCLVLDARRGSGFPSLRSRAGHTFPNLHDRCLTSKTPPWNNWEIIPTLSRRG